MRRVPLAVAAATVFAGSAAAQSGQTYLTALPQMLEVQAQDATAPVGSQNPPTLGRVLSFLAYGFQFSGPLPVRYVALPGYAWVIGPCPSGGGAPNSPPASPQSPQQAPQSVAAAMGRAPGAMDLLPYPAKPPTVDYSLTMEIREALVGLSPVATQNPSPQTDALSAAWAAASVEGQGKVASVQPMPASAVAPTAITSYLVLLAAPYYDLDGAAYTAQTALGAFTIKYPGSDREVPVPLPPGAIFGSDGRPTITVTGQLTGGRWAQGAGLVFLPSPQGPAAASCGGRGYGRMAADAATLQANGVTPGQPFSRTDAIFVRMWPFAP